jgi:UDP-3-O-[3-hydroxymyristoyl] glucosamine N-acyltransferase
MNDSPKVEPSSSIHQHHSLMIGRMKALAKGHVHHTASVASSARLSKDVKVGSFAHIGKLAQIGSGTVIHAHAFVGDAVKLGASCQVGSHVSVQNCTAGDRVVFKSGCRVGEDGFGFHPAGTVDKTKVVKKPQTMRVLLENDVEIGANSTVDRGSWRDTRIGAHTKLDNLVQIGHNVHIGMNCLIAAQSGVAGSATIGNRVLMGGQSGIAQYIKVGDDCQIAAKSGVTSDLSSKAKVGGMPAVNIIQFHRAFLETFPRGSADRRIK